MNRSVFARSPRPLAPRNRSLGDRGFALLITITLLAFVVALLVGLALYTRVETAIAGNTQRQAQARENAVLGLNVALRQLQLHAGPDQRVTATAQNFGGTTATRSYTGVWSSDAAATDAPTTPLTWLVSGNEAATAPRAITPAAPGAVARLQNLVGLNSTGDRTRSVNWVDAPLVDISTFGVPGLPPAAPAVIGRYAWWVGDQGVKAPVAIPDSTSAVTYPPYDSSDLRARLGQQISLGAGAASAADGAPIFEPRDPNNAGLVANQKVTTLSQIAFLRSPTNTTLGWVRAQQNFHAWSPNNYGVLADTAAGGLRQDLSLAPSLLGAAFAAWSNYPAYVESFFPPVLNPTSSDSTGTAAPTATVPIPAPVIVPAYSDDPLRRRYRLTPPTVAGGAAHSVAPVLSFFGMSFSVRENQTAAPLMEVAVRCVVTLWNPYTGALVPEDLRVEVSGLPEIRVEDSAGGDHRLDLQATLAGGASPFRLSLPWTPEDGSVDKNSWLPGRVFSWAAIENFSEPAGGNPFVFHSPDATPTGAGQGIVRLSNVAHHLDRTGATAVYTRTCRSTDAALVQVRVLRASDDTELAIYQLNVPAFGPTSALTIDHKYVDFAIIRRLPETDEVPAAATGKWLSAAGRDPRHPGFPAIGFVGGSNGEDPALYGGDGQTGFAVRNSSRLLDRASEAYSYNEDTPVFELPRAPLLSIGQLQHLPLLAAAPFAIGNPWGATALVNEIRAGALFDRFFFSGLVDGVTPGKNATGDLIMPNPLLKPLRKADASRVSIADVRMMAAPPTSTDPDGNVIPGVAPSAYSSKFLLQGGAFNLNSASAAAWSAVLRGVRFPAPKSFSYLVPSAATGTAADTDLATVQSTDAQFFRFSQSAQETYQAEAGLADNWDISPANTHLFRRGVRALSGAQTADLAAKIVAGLAVKHAAEGPFRSLEEFLAPSVLFAGVDSEGNALAARSLLEGAIANSALNAAVAEFSSQWLTPADVMTALAPLLFARSDTFIIRSYGEAVNPGTSATEGRAWCEALVQRLPEYFDRSDAPEASAADFDAPSNPAVVSSAPTSAHQLNKIYGRRFKVVSFRWMTRADL